MGRQRIQVQGLIILLLASFCFADIGDLELTDNIILNDYKYVGLGPAKGRIIFDDDTIDLIKIWDADLAATGSVTSGKVFYSTYWNAEPYTQMQWTLDSAAPEVVSDKTISFYGTPSGAIFYPTTPPVDLGSAVIPYQWRNIYLGDHILPVYDGRSTLGSSAYRFKTIWTSENAHIGTSSSNYRIDARAGGDIDSVTFTGSGLDDATSGGTFNGTVSDDVDYKVEIDGGGTPDTFKWSDDGGSTWDVETVSITGAAQTLNNSVAITFAATTGHTLTDYWEFTVTIHNPMWLQDAAGNGVIWVGNNGRVGILDETPSYALEVNGDIGADSIYISHLLAINNPPLSATATGTTGQMAFDSKYVYRAVATNTWKRVALASWTNSHLLLPIGDKILLPTGDFIILSE